MNSITQPSAYDVQREELRQGRVGRAFLEGVRNVRTGDEQHVLDGILNDEPIGMLASRTGLRENEVEARTRLLMLQMDRFADLSARTTSTSGHIDTSRLTPAERRELAILHRSMGGSSQVNRLIH